MGTFFKIFGKGLLYTILLPFVLVAWVLYAVYCLFVFIFMGIKATILFFKGENVSGDTKEDKEARRILLEKEQEKEDKDAAVSQLTQAAVATAQMQTVLFNQAMMQQAAYNQQQMQNQQMFGQPQFGPQQFGQPVQPNLINQQPAQQIIQQPTDVVQESEVNNDDNAR